MKLSRDAWLMIFLLIVLVIIMTVAGMGNDNAAPALSSLSSMPNGAKALKLWLPELGFTVNEDLVSEFAPPDDVETILILQPFLIGEDEWQTLDDWVEAGGTLLIASSTRMYAIAAHYEFNTVTILEGIGSLNEAAPLHTSPALTAPVELQTDVLLTTERDDYVTHLATPVGAATVSFERGRGRVILVTAPYIFTNLGLKNDANAAFVLNLLALAEPQSTVWFDEWHHGMVAAPPGEEIVGPGQWLRRTPVGNAFLFILAVAFFGLLLQGRAFGRPVPLPREIKRRTVMEHITAIANLNRRAGHRSDVLRQYHQQLKRHLGKRYRIDPSLPDEAYVETLKLFNRTLDDEKLLRLLRGLTQTNVSEADMVRLAAEAAEWIKE